MGYRLVEINTRSLPQPDADRGNLLKGSYDGRIPELLDSLPIKIHQIHISNNPGDIGSRHREPRRQAIEWIERSLDLCQVFKPKYVGIHPGGHTENLANPRVWDAVAPRVIESARKLARSARTRGMRLMLETTKLDLGKLSQIVRTLSEEEVGILVDTGHCHCHLGQDPADVIRDAGDRLYSLHIHDNHGKGDDHLIPGEGSIQWERIVKALEDVSYTGVFMMECCNSKTTRDKKTIARLAKEVSERLLAGSEECLTGMIKPV
jgi:sugar phosphate isomerase/epimerase